MVRPPGHTRDMPKHFLIIEARFYPEITDALADGATAELEKRGASFERVAVPVMVPLTTMLTPGRLSPSSASVTSPVTWCCARPGEAARMSKARSAPIR